MRTSLQRWIVGSVACFGTMAFVAIAAMLSPPQADESARIASGCPAKAKGPVTPLPNDA